MNFKTTVEREKMNLYDLRGSWASESSKEIILAQINKRIEQAMTKAALAVLEELEWKGKGFNSGSEVVTWSDAKRDEIKSSLTKDTN